MSFKNFIAQLEEHKIASLEWTIWYDSDQYEFNDDPIVIDEDGHTVDIVTIEGGPGSYNAILHPAFKTEDGDHNSEMGHWKDILWDLSDKFDKSGVFKLDVKKRTVQQIADAYIPDSNVEIDPIDPVELKFSLDEDDGLFDGPFYPTWSAKDPNSPYRVQYWFDPSNFTPKEFWGSPHENKGGTKPNKEKAGWINWEDHKNLKDAILQANRWHQNGTSYGEVKYPKSGEALIKGVTASRVLDAWDVEVYVVNKKGHVKDRRGPFTIEYQEYRHTLKPLDKKWRNLHPKYLHSINRVDDFEIKEKYDSVQEAYRDAHTYVTLNGGAELKYFIRISDNAGNEVELIYSYKDPSYSLNHREVLTYHMSSHPISTNKILIELHPDDLYNLASQIKAKEQAKWVTDFALSLYGKQVSYVNIDIVSEYNDQGYDSVIESIDAYDEDENILDFDPECLEKFIGDDFTQYIVNYIFSEEAAIHLIDSNNLKLFEEDMDANRSMLDVSKYKLVDNPDLFDFITTNMDELLEDAFNSISTDGLSDYYKIGEFEDIDERWKDLRLFVLTDSP